MVRFRSQKDTAEAKASINGDEYNYTLAEVPLSKESRKEAESKYSRKKRTSKEKCSYKNERRNLFKFSVMSCSRSPSFTDTGIKWNIEDVAQVPDCTDGGTVFTFSPIFLQWQYQDENFCDCIGIQFSLPSGLILVDTDFQDKLHVSVSDDGVFLIVKCVWPEGLEDDNLLEKALKKANINQNIMQEIVSGYITEMTSASRITETEYAVSIAKIRLKSICEQKIFAQIDLKDRVIVLLRKVSNKDLESE